MIRAGTLCMSVVNEPNEANVVDTWLS